MRCRHPVPVLQSRILKLTTRRRCQTCLGCLVTRREAWVGRMLLEARLAKRVYYWTMTYRDEDLPGPLLDSDDPKRFWKRLRKAGHKFRYLCVGEYGTLKGRPHWHAVVYTDEFLPRDYVTEKWGKGNVNQPRFDASPKGMRYVAKYIHKEGDELQAPGPKLLSNSQGFAERSLIRLGRAYAEGGGVELPATYLVYGKKYPLVDRAQTFFVRGFHSVAGKPPTVEGFGERMRRFEREAVLEQLQRRGYAAIWKHDGATQELYWEDKSTGEVRRGWCDLGQALPRSVPSGAASLEPDQLSLGLVQA